MLNGMRLSLLAAFAVPLSLFAAAQNQASQSAFEVASVRPSAHEVGPDYNNQITYASDRFSGRNVTLKRLIAEAWHCQLNQVVGPPWIEHNEYDVEARVPDGTSREQVALMLRSFLFDRFKLKEHSETRQLRAYDLTVGKGGPRIQPEKPGDAPATGPGLHFHGDMRQFADLLAIQFSIPAPQSPNEPVKAGGSLIPVLDKTGLKGVYDISLNVGPPELGTDAFTGWKRVLEEQLGLKIENRKGDVPVVVVDDAEKVPTAN